MKKMLISEDEKSRILNLHQNLGYKTSLNEQSVPQSVPQKPQPNVQKPTANQTGLTPKQPLKPTLEVGGVKYYVPNLTDTSLDSFANLTGPMAEMDEKDFYANLGVRWALGGISPFGIPKETYQKQMDWVPEYGYKHSPHVFNFNMFKKAVKPALLAYLKSWRPNQIGMNVLKSPVFLANPAIVGFKSLISNFDEVYPKMINMAAKKSGIQIG